jgi:Protein of unknown function (DUF3142)
VKRVGKCTATAVIAVAALLAISSRAALTSFRRTPVDRLGHLPHVMLWAWERREDLSFIDPQRVGVAYLAGTLHLSGDRVLMRPRLQPLVVPHNAVMVAVIRIEADRLPAPTMSPHQRADAARAIARVADHSPAAIQIDFDATRSQRVFYRDLLADVRNRLPPAMPLSITALASWCIYDDWIADLPIDEAVPMLFRMGADSMAIDQYLQKGGDFAPALGRYSVGISTDEPARAIPAGRRVYIFSPHAWTDESAATAIAEAAQ